MGRHYTGVEVTGIHAKQHADNTEIAIRTRRGRIPRATLRRFICCGLKSSCLSFYVQLNPHPGNVRHQFPSENRIAVKAKTTHDLSALIGLPLSRPDKLAAMRIRYEPLCRPNFAHDIAATVLQWAR